MKIIVITGSTRGIGYGLAEEFLKRGCAVVIGGRTPAASAEAGRQLAQAHPAERILAHAHDVTVYEQVQALWDAAVARFGRVDVWINNAGMGHPTLPFWQQPPEVMQAVVTANLLGAMYGCKVALAGMLAQGGGMIYDMEGFGSTGRLQAGMSIYGATKAATTYFSRALALDAKDTPVKIGAIRPGMVMTDLVLDQFKGREAELERAKPIFNIIADRVENVTPFIAEQVVAGKPNIVWLTQARLMARFMLAPFRKRQVV